jgi:release factor glutamine methyltransferase
LKTIGQWLIEASRRLAQQADAATASLDAQLIASEVTGLSRASLYAHPERTLNTQAVQKLDDLLQHRCAGVPLAILTGKREFWSMELKVTPGVLVPRPDTEVLVEIVIQLAPTVPAGSIVDLGTGTGAIAIALALELAGRQVFAIERNATAVDVAASNIQRYAPGKVHLIQGNWLSSATDQSMAIIAANPPYLASNDPHLSGLAHEPGDALISGAQGLDDLETIIQQCTRVGKSGALLLLEHGCEQGESVKALLHCYGYLGIKTHQDLAGLDRVSYGYRPGL